MNGAPSLAAGAALPSERRSLRARAARGTALTVGGQLTSQGLRLASNLILTRLLFPEAFGLMAIVNLVMTGLKMISNVGIQPAIVRHERGDDPAFLNTAWSMAALRGLVLWAIGLAAAIPVARLYGLPELAVLLPVATSSALLTGLFSTKLATLQRHIDLKRSVIIEVTGQITGLAAMVALALQYRSVWALVAGGLVTAGVRMSLSHLAIPGPRNRFQWEPEAAREIFSFGKWIFVSTLFTFLALRADVALLGKLLPLGMLGVYSVGIMLATIVRDLSGRVIQSVLMPALAASHREGGAVLARNFRGARRVLLPVGLLAVCGTAAAAPAFFELLYDDRYHEAGWIAQLSMLTLWVSYLQESSGRALLAIGDSRSWAASNVTRTFATVGACAAGFALGGLPGLMLGMAGGGLCGYAVVARRLAREGLPVAGRDAAYTAGGIAIGLTLWLAPPELAPLLGSDETALLGLAIGALLLGPYAVWVATRVLRDLRR